MMAGGLIVAAGACQEGRGRAGVVRGGPPCESPAVWPSLPTVEAIAARTPGGQARERAGARSSESMPLPQYAFLRDSAATRCDPVIVVEAGPAHYVYWGVDLTSNGIAPHDRIELLGTDRAAASR